MSKWETWLDGLLFLLSVGLAFRLYNVSKSPILEMATIQDPPHILHGPDSAQRLLPLRLRTVGGYITVEDIIRYLHEHPTKLNQEATNILKQMEQTQQQILQTEEDVQEIERQLNKLALDIYDGLADSEKLQLRINRNLDSVNGVEAKYWRELIERAESNQ